MNCHVCGRSLKEDSRFCDFCGTAVINEELVSQHTEAGKLDINFLIKGILISVLITLAISTVFKKLGINIFFGGLFLPFFFRRKKREI